MQRIRQSNLSLGSQAYEGLKRIILNGQVNPGEKIKEGEIAQALGISRTPVREAINRLQKEGFIETFPQRGAFVVQFSERDVFELFLIRESLEGLAASMAAEKISEGSLVKLESCIEGFEEPFTEKDIQRYAREDLKFHQTIVTLSEARRLMSLISTLHDHIRIFRLTTRGLSARMKSSLEEHKGIIEAVRARNPEEAERRMRQHIRNVRDGVMENIKIFVIAGKGLTSGTKEGREWDDSATSSSKMRAKSSTSGL